MPILQLPPGTPSEVRGPDNEEDDSEFDSNNMNHFVRLFDYHRKNELNINFHSQLHLHSAQLNIIVK